MPWELFCWYLLEAGNSRALNKHTPGNRPRLWPCRAHVGPAERRANLVGLSVGRASTGRRAPTLLQRSRWEGLPRWGGVWGCCSQVPGSLPGASAWRGTLPCSTDGAGVQCKLQPPAVVSLLIVSAGCPSLWCRHLFLAVLDLSGWGRRLQLFPPLPMDHGVLRVGAALLPPQPSPFPHLQRVEAAGRHRH